MPEQKKAPLARDWKGLLLVLAMCGGAMLLAILTALLVVSNSMYRQKERAYEMAMEENRREWMRLSEENESLSAELDALRRQPPQKEREAALFRELERNTGLIPVEPSLGGTMRYYGETFRVLSDRHAYVYAEDGHSAVEMLLGYRENPDKTVEWTLCAYDAGGGWELPREGG